VSRDDADYLWDRTGDDPEVERLERLLGAYAHDAPLREPPPRRRRAALIAASVVAVAAIAVIVFLVVRRDRGSPHQVALGGDAGGAQGFAFQVHGGAALCDGTAADGRGTLRVGSWLETEVGATAQVQVADIGEIQLRSGSRLRLVATGPDEHRLELARGRLSARVTAPPRLFVIDTPVAAAVDLGCAYDLEVDDAGRTHVRVTSGAVSLEGHGLTSWVPWGFEVTAAPGRGPGTPVRTAAPAVLRDAVAQFDEGAGGGWSQSPLDIILGSVVEEDAVTLWNMLTRTQGEDRAAVFARLAELAIRPEWVLEEDVLAAVPDALEAWRLVIEGTWNVGP
jgi:ferric-dicitrate binding protein FerR (iron transport regulator)